jgi:hypothetical protein
LPCQLSFPPSGLSHSIFQYFRATGKLSHTRRPSRPIIVDSDIIDLLHLHNHKGDSIHEMVMAIRIPPLAGDKCDCFRTAPYAQQPAWFQSNGSSRRFTHELHIQLPGTTNRPAAFKLPQKTHSTILNLRHIYLYRSNYILKILMGWPARTKTIGKSL